MFININTLQAGTSLTSIPDSCEATGSLLFYPDLTADEVMAEIRATIDRVTASDYWLRDHPQSSICRWTPHPRRRGSRSRSTCRLTTRGS